MTFEMEPPDEPCPDCGSTHHRECTPKVVKPKAVKLSVPEHLRTGKVYEALREQTMSRTITGHKEFINTDTQVTATPSPDTEPHPKILSVEASRELVDEIAALRQRLAEMTKRAEIAESMARDADQALTAARQRLQDTERERDDHYENMASWRRVAQEYKRDLTAAQAEIQRMREALEPFARLLAEGNLSGGEAHVACSILWEDLERAEAALRTQGGESGDTTKQS